MHRPTREELRHRRALLVGLALVAALVGVWVLARDRPTTEVAGRAGGAATTSAPAEPDASAPPPAPTTTTPTGRFVASLTTGNQVGDGPLRTYRVEVEEGTGVDPDLFADEVEVILSNPRGWTTVDGISLQRVAADADIVVTLATAPTVDLLCHPFDTEGQTSCAQPQRAIINLDRWRHGAESSGLEVPAYRGYVISHEVGHTLGHGHVGCPTPGAPAPVMMQQTYSIDDCVPNAWPLIPEAAGG